METEQQLIEAIRSGERAALRRLYDRYSGFATALALRYIPDRDEVRDVLQDSFVRILSTVEKFRYQGEGSLKAWVGKIVSHRAVDYLREHQRFVVVDALPDFIDEEQEPELEHVPPDVLLTMIGRLPANYRTVLNLFVFEQWSHKDIARLLGVKESTSSSLFYRAKKMLAKMVKEYLNNPIT